MMILNGVENWQVSSNFPSDIVAYSKLLVEKTTLYFRPVTHRACDVGHVWLRPFLGDDEEDCLGLVMQPTTVQPPPPFPILLQREEDWKGTMGL